MNMKKIIYVICTVLVLGASACTEDVDYTPGLPVAEDCIYASFTTDGEETFVSATDEKKVTVTVTRENTANEVVVPLKTLPQTDDCFQVPASVTFAAGAATATFDITFSEVEAEEVYTYSVALDESAVDSYSQDYITSITGTVLPEANWDTSLGQGVYSSDIFGPTYCEVQKDNGQNWYRVVTPYDSYSVVVKVNEDNTVRLREQPLAWANVGLPDPELIYISLNSSYTGQDVSGGAGILANMYDPATGVITMAVDYNCSAGALGTTIDQIQIPQ